MSEYSQEAINKVDAYLEHYGVKGMKWGVHRKGIKSARDDARKKRLQESAKTSGAAAGLAIAINKDNNGSSKSTEHDKSWELRKKAAEEEIQKAKIMSNMLLNQILEKSSWTKETKNEIVNAVGDGWCIESFPTTYKGEKYVRLIKHSYSDDYKTHTIESKSIYLTKKDLKHDSVSKVEEYLEHHGILGQKWGVKHGPPYPLDKKTSKKVSSGKVTINVKDLSDDDLKKIVQRLNMEKQLKDLTKEQKSKGKKFGEKALDKLGETTLNIIFGAAQDVGKKALTKKLEAALEKASK